LTAARRWLGPLSVPIGVAVETWIALCE